MGYFQLFLWAFIFINTGISILTVFSDKNRDIAAIWAWLLLLIIFPGFGWIIYLFLGRKISKEDIFNLQRQAKVGLPKFLEIQNKEKEEQIKYFTSLDFNQTKNKKYEVARTLLEMNQPPVSGDNTIDYYADGEEKFSNLIKDIENAKHHIHISYYIFRGDKIGKKIVKAAEKRAKDGVEVKIQYDPVGARSLKKSLFKELEKYGGQTETSFGSRFHLLNIRLNYRNHRKIVVIDGKIGYVGGFNVGDEYLGEDEKMGYWRDTHVRIEGTAVHQLQQRFIIDWNASKKSDLIAYEPFYFPMIETTGDKEVQIVSSGPESETEEIKKGLLKMINLAKDTIYIQTPYFIPDDALQAALELALLSGVKVKLMIPNKPDHPFIYQATLSYVEELMKLGGDIYIYDKGFLHSKTVSIDNQVVSIGTANLDIRSFKLNFEVNAFIYNQEFAMKHEQYFLKDIEDSYLLTSEIIERYSLLDRFRQQFSRLLSPIL